MWHPRIQNGSEAQTQACALEANVAWAGLALACAYSSSDEYEAEVIQVRRQAGAYRSQHRRSAFLAFGIAAAAIVLVALAI